MKTIFYFSCIILLFFSCNFLDKKENSKNNSNYLINYNIQNTDSNIVIDKDDRIVLERRVCENCFRSIKVDTIKGKIFVIIKDELFLINCVEDEIYTQTLDNKRISRINKKIEIFDNYYIYSNLGELIIFDSTLSFFYNSWDFLDNQPSRIKLGISGVHIEYFHEQQKQDDFLRIEYKLLSDIADEDEFKRILTDTLYW